jgi:hypothetical protein
MRASDVSRISIELDVGDEPALRLELADDGGVHRQGSGTDTEDREAQAGTIDPDVFEQLRAKLPEPVLSGGGRYSDPNPVGERCRLSVVAESGSERNGVEFVYGSESQGPPPPVAALVEDAVALTDAWYRAAPSA